MDEDINGLNGLFKKIRKEFDEKSSELMKCFGKYRYKDCFLNLGLACIFDEKCKMHTENIEKE